jgi:hypothetical protein
MIASFDAARERRRPDEYAQARERFNAARLREQQERAASREALADASVGREELIKKLEPVEELLRLRKYVEAEARLRALLQEFQGEPRVFFALGQAASLSAEDALDENLRAQRLGSALSHYRMAVGRASLDTDRTLICRSHAAMGRILAFTDRNAEALREFDAALQTCDAQSSDYRGALEGKKALQAQP